MLSVELIADREFGGYTARVPDIPAYGEGTTQDEAIADLKVAQRGYIEAFGLDDAMGAAGAHRSTRTLQWDLAELACG